MFQGRFGPKSSTLSNATVSLALFSLGLRGPRPELQNKLCPEGFGVRTDKEIHVVLYTGMYLGVCNNGLGFRE